MYINLPIGVLKPVSYVEKVLGLFILKTACIKHALFFGQKGITPRPGILQPL